MKTNQVNGQVQQWIRKHGVLFFIVIASFASMGGCNDKEAEEIPADEVTTNLQQAPAVPLWVPYHTNPSIRFYFIPEMGIYYDAFLNDYVYWNGSYWVYSPVLPHGHLYFDLFNSNIVFLGIGISYPWHHHHYYVSHYPIYFFAGRNFHHNKHGWRYYDENGGRFIGAHHHAKYNVHYNIHHNFKNKPDRSKQGHPGFNEPKNRKKPSHQQPIHKTIQGKDRPAHQGKQQQFQDNKNGGRKESSMYKQQPGGNKTIQTSGHRDVQYKQRSGSGGNRQVNQQGGSKSGGGKKGGSK